jgi:hypothetical protein
MQLEWQNIVKESDDQLKSQVHAMRLHVPQGLSFWVNKKTHCLFPTFQVARGEEADLALHKAGGFIKGRNADVGMWRDVASPEKMATRSGNYVSISGDTGVCACMCVCVCTCVCVCVCVTHVAHSFMVYMRCARVLYALGAVCVCGHSKHRLRDFIQSSLSHTDEHTIRQTNVHTLAQ